MPSVTVWRAARMVATAFWMRAWSAGAEGVQVGFDPADQLADLADLLIGRGGVGACPGLEVAAACTRSRSASSCCR